jgi:hypothetical protein
MSRIMSGLMLGVMYVIMLGVMSRIMSGLMLGVMYVIMLGVMYVIMSKVMSRINHLPLSSLNKLTITWN